MFSKYLLFTYKSAHHPQTPQVRFCHVAPCSQTRLAGVLLLSPPSSEYLGVRPPILGPSPGFLAQGLPKIGTDDTRQSPGHLNKSPGEDPSRGIVIPSSLLLPSDFKNGLTRVSFPIKLERPCCHFSILRLLHLPVTY